MKRIIALIYLAITTLNANSQTTSDATDCFPDCNFTFQEIENELRPNFSTTDAIDSKLIEIVAQKMEQFRKEDASKFHFLKNKYCAAQTGWIQNGECLHGGPPPCCTAPQGAIPWKKISPEKAKTTLLAEWHQLREKRNKEITQAVNNGYNVLRIQLFTEFNASYKNATECIKILRDDKVFFSKNTAQVNQYISSMGNIYSQMKEYTDGKPSNAQQIQNIEFNTQEMEKLEVDICKKTQEATGKYYVPLLTQHNNMYSEFPFQKKDGLVKSNQSEVEKQNGVVQKRIVVDNSDEHVDFTKNVIAETPVINKSSVVVRSKSVDVTTSASNLPKTNINSQNKEAINKDDNKEVIPAVSPVDKIIEETKIQRLKKDSLQKLNKALAAKIIPSEETQTDDEKFFYIKAGVGINYQQIPTIQNITYLDTTNASKVGTSNTYGLQANLRMAINVNPLLSIHVEPFASYGWHIIMSKIIDNTNQNKTTGKDWAYGGTVSVGLNLKEQFNLEQDIRFMLKGGYVYRKGEENFLNITDSTQKGWLSLITSSYSYSSLKVGAGIYINLGGNDKYIELSAYKELPSFLKELTNNIFSFNTKVFTYEVKAAYKYAILAVQFSPNYPIASSEGVLYSDNFIKTSKNLFSVSLSFPINIFSQIQKNK